MKTKLLRFLLILLIFAISTIIFLSVRNGMSLFINNHSVAHYFVRLFFIIFSVSVFLDMFRFLSSSHPLEVFGCFDNQRGQFKMSNIIKRMLDLTLSIVILIGISPILLGVAIAIYILEGFPVFYISKRFISSTQSASIFKFRTMVKDATDPKYRLNERFMRSGYLDIPLECDVYTRIGRFLERTQIVEMLQLLNVIIDGMSLVGNRPLPESNVKMLQQFEGWQQRFSSPAGLSGISQIVGKMNLSPEERLNLECLYSKIYHAKHANILVCDSFIFYNTFCLLVFGEALPLSKARKFLELAAGKTMSEPSIDSTSIVK